MAKGLIKKLLGGTLAVSLATAGVFGGHKYQEYKHEQKQKQKKDFEEIFEATRAYAETSDQYRLNPTSTNKLAMYTAEDTLDNLMVEQGARDLSMHLRLKDILYYSYNHDGIKQFYAGKIIERNYLKNGIIEFITKSKDEVFEGIVIPKNQTTIGHFQIGNHNVININLSDLERTAKKLDYFKGPITKEHLEDLKKSSQIHERTHVNGGNEFEAYMASLKAGHPYPLRDFEYLEDNKNLKPSELPYKDVAIGILKRFRVCLNTSKKTSLYNKYQNDKAKLKELSQKMYYDKCRKN